MHRTWLHSGYLQTVTWGLLIMGGSYLSSLYSYLLFHSLVELFGIVIAAGTFMLAWNSRRFLGNNYLVVIGIGSLAAAAMSLIHTLAYRGMGVFTGFDANLPTQLWIATRYCTAITFLAAPLLLRRQVNLTWLFTAYSVATALVFASIFAWRIFPVCYVEGVGLTAFKKASEYIISLLFLAGAGVLYLRRAAFDRDVFRLLVGSIAAAIGCELAFTLYVGVYDLSNLIGHLLSVLSYFLIYRALIQTGLVRPYDLLFRELRQAEQRYRDLFNEAPVEYLIISATDESPVIEDCNAVFADALGYRREEVIGRPVGDFYTAGSRALMENGGYRQARAGRLAPQERELVAKDGHVIETLVRAAPEADAEGRVVRIRAAYVNIGDRKRVERELRRAHDDMERRVQQRTADLSFANEALAQHAQRLEILRTIDRAILAAQLAAEIAQAAVEHVRQAMGCCRVSVVLINAESQPATLLAVDADHETSLRPGAAIPLDALEMLEKSSQDSAASLAELTPRAQMAGYVSELLAAGARYCIAVPLCVGSQRIGALHLWTGSADGLTSESRDFAGQVADSLAVAIHHARLFEQLSTSRQQLQRLSRSLVEAQENQARQIGQDLHDDAGQALTALKLGLGLIARDAECPPHLAARALELKQMTDDLMERLHGLSVNLRPVSLDRLGLAAALKQYAETFRRQSGMPIEIATLGLGETRLPPEVETTLYRVVQEAITNVARHARATQAGVIVERRPAGVVAIIEDNGVGFDQDVAARSERLGLVGMRERVEMLGGSLYVESQPGMGTTVFAEIPC